MLRKGGHNVVSEKLFLDQFRNRVAIKNIAPGIDQVLAPFYHTDGDMIEMYIQPSERGIDHIRLSDMGMTLMRLSYAIDVEIASTRKFINNVINQNRMNYSDGTIFCDFEITSAGTYVPYFAQCISRVMSLTASTKEYIRSAFYETIEQYLSSSLVRYETSKNVEPIRGIREYTVDFCIKNPANNKIIYLFPVKESDNGKANDIVTTILYMKVNNVRIHSLYVCEDLESLSDKYRRRLVNAAGKGWYRSEDFLSEGAEYISDELDQLA